MKPDFPATATIMFIGITAVVFVMIIMGLTRGLKESRHTNYVGVLYGAAIGMIAWLTLLTFLSVKGIFADFESMPPPLMLTFTVTLGVMVFLLLNKRFGTIIDEIPLHWMIVAQSFRILVEIVLWMLGEEGIAPEQMTWEGLNFDVIAGLLAPIVAWLAFGGGRNNKKLAIAYNIIGMALLINILTIAVLSIPQVGVMTPPNTFVAYWPMIWLPGFVAPFALVMHAVSLRQLIRRK